MSKRSEHLAVRALPALAHELRAYKRRAVTQARRRAQATEGSAMRRALQAKLERLRAMTPAQFRGWYQSEEVGRIVRTPRHLLFAQTFAPASGRAYFVVCA